MGRLLDAIRRRDGNFAPFFLTLGFNLRRDAETEQVVRCHFHDDGDPSLSVDVEHGIFCCHATSCGRRGGVLAAAAFSWGVSLDEARRRLRAEYLTKPKTKTADECAALFRRSRDGLVWTALRQDDVRARLAAASGWSLAALEHAKVGYLPEISDHPPRAVFAIFDETGTRIIGVKLRAMAACDRKCRTITLGRSGLIGADRLAGRGGRRVVVSAGEKDMLCGMTAMPDVVWVSHSGGEGAALASFSALFEGANVTVAYDKGEARVWERASELVEVAAELKVIDFPFADGAMTASGATAKDVTDFVELEGAGNLRAAIDAAPRIVTGDARLRSPRPSRTKAAAPAVASGSAVALEFIRSLDDIGNAQRFAERHGRDVAFDVERGVWRVWDGRRWVHDRNQTVVRRAMETARSIRAEAESCDDEEMRLRLSKHAKASASHAKSVAMLKLAEALLAVPGADFDKDPWVLNVENGTVDLRTGDLREHRREDRITKLVPVPFRRDAECRRWCRFLVEVFADPALIAFLRRAVGYTLTGNTSEQVLFILVGIGANGKGTFLRGLRAITGDYAVQAAMETFLIQRTDVTRPREDLAALAGARFVVASEVGEDRKLDESTVKHVTGGDPVRARALYCNSSEFDPQFKLWVDTNYLPRIRGTDEGIWRRILPMQMPRSFRGAAADKGLDGVLRDEAPGILAWAVAGALEWHQQGLDIPDCVEEARRQYRSTEDVVGAYLEDRADLLPGWAVLAGALYDDFRAWCAATGTEPMTQKAFGARLEQRGLRAMKVSGQRARLGLKLKMLTEANRQIERQRNFVAPPVTEGGSPCGA